MRAPMALKSHFSLTPTVECGCDEVGRGCLAGPVCAAAVIFPYDYTNEEINDSKQLTGQKRDQLKEIIERDALAYAVAEVSETDIDKMNILRASGCRATFRETGTHPCGRQPFP